MADGADAAVNTVEGIVRTLLGGARTLKTHHVTELFQIIKARLDWRKSRFERETPIRLEWESYTCVSTIALTAILTDPYDGQRYRLALMPADTQVVLLPPKGAPWHPDTKQRELPE